MHRPALKDCVLLSLLLSGAVLLTPSVHAQPPGNKPPAKKPAPAPAKPSGPIVLGTTQMAGDFGKFGVTYTIGKSSPINFTLKAAEYSLAPVSIGSRTWVPKANEKLLVLHFAIHNPNPREERYYWAGVTFTAVDSKDVNHNFVNAVTRTGETEPVDISLKPAQKLDLTTVIVVPAEGVVPKLIVEREKGAPVIRYDLRGKVKPLPATFADPADTSGATPLPMIPAQPGTFYSIGSMDARLDEVAYVTGPLLRREPGSGKQWITATFTIKNRTTRTLRYDWSSFAPVLIDADGEKTDYNQSILKASREESATGELAPGEEARIRFYFALPTNVTGKTLRLAEGKDSRVFAYDLATAPSKKP